ncbi:hypothetical protein [Bordetella sp. 15P40C-2]|uniref:hypothetical protein n=1 Tax=Bordetella sp. 15P40C-2 TaxID=2572246 RepID=UPI00132B9B2F|nr:hypothetical protein [Bordetella sp. 15P40C-2]MVW72872.1 hypothetical protein [Bordetella sp. 15P40C-2]
MRIDEFRQRLKTIEEKIALGRKPFAQRFYTEELLLPEETTYPRTAIIGAKEQLGIDASHILVCHVVHRLRSALLNRELTTGRGELPKGGAFASAYVFLSSISKEEDELTYWKKLDDFQKNRYGECSWDLWVHTIESTVSSFVYRYFDGDGDGENSLGNEVEATANEIADIKTLKIRLQAEHELPQKFTEKKKEAQTWKLIRRLLGLTNWELAFIVVNIFKAVCDAPSVVEDFGAEIVRVEKFEKDTRLIHTAENEVRLKCFNKLEDSFVPWADTIIKILIDGQSQSKKARLSSVHARKANAVEKVQAVAAICVELLEPDETLSSLYRNRKQKKRRDAINRKCFQTKGELSGQADPGVRWIGDKKQILNPRTQKFADAFSAPPEATPAAASNYDGGFRFLLGAIDLAVRKMRISDRLTT